MEEDEEYDSDDSDGTVLLTDYVENPQKTDMKRRRLSNLHDRSDEFVDENTAPEDVNANGWAGNSPEKKRSNVDKNWHIGKYFACISKNNDTNIQNNDSKDGQKLDFNEKQVQHNFQTRHGNISKGNSTSIDNDEVICLDSDDETQINDKSHDQDRESVKISAINYNINNPNMEVDKPAPLTTRRATATTDILERNKMSQILEENKRTKIKVLKPSAINARRATTHFEENYVNSNVIGKTTSISKNTYTGNKNERESDVYRSTTPRLPESQSADGKTSINADCNDITGIRTAALDNNTHTSPLQTSNKPLKTGIDKNNGLINKNRQGINIFLNVQTNKRFGSNNAIQLDPKRIKIDTEPTDPAQLNKNTPRKDIKITALKETKKLEASQPYVNVRKEMHVPSAVHNAINDHLGTERSNGHNGNKTSEVKNTTGAISEKRMSDDAKSKSPANNVKSDKNKRNEDIHTAFNMNEKLTAGKIHLNVASTEYKTLNDGSERIDGCDDIKRSDLKSTTSAEKENHMQYAKTLNNVYENRESSRSDILQEPSTSCDKEETAKIQYADVVYGANHKQVQDKQITSEVIEQQEAIKIQDDRGIDKVVDELKTRKLQDEQGNIPRDEEETNKEQYYFETTEAHDKHAVSKEQNEHEISEIQGEVKHKQQPSKILLETDEKKTSDKQEINKALDHQVTNELYNEPKTYKIQDDDETIKVQTSDEHYMNSTLNKKKTSNEVEVAIVSETNDKQEMDIANNQLEANNVQDDYIPSESLDKRETSETGNGQERSTVRENNVSEMQDLRQETHKKNNENETTESSNVQETVKENETTHKASRDDSEDNERVLKFQVGFFTLIKEYLKDIFPESAMELHNLIETLINDTRNGQVQTDVKYSCPKCSRVSNYSSRVLNNLESEENKTNADGYQKCGFCNGTRKLHNSYLRRFLSKKYTNADKKEDVKLVSPGIDQTKRVEQSRNSSTDESVISNSQTTSTTEAKTDNNLGSTPAVEDSSLSLIVNNDKQARNYTFTQNNWKENTSKKHPIPNETPSINMSQLDNGSSIDNNVNKDTINRTTSPVASGADTVKLTGKEASDQHIPITKKNEICTQSKLGHFDEESTTENDLGLSNKRKNDVTYKETTDRKRIKTTTEETNHQRVKNLTAVVSETSTQRNDTLANDRPDKIQIISIQNITSHRTERLNSSLQSHPSIETEDNRAANSELFNENTPGKSSNESLKEFQTNTSDPKTHEACLNSKTNSDNMITAETEQLHERAKHFSEDGNQATEGNSSENINRERQSEVDENGKGESSNNTSTGSILETNEANANQVRNTRENNQGNEDVLKPLMDCFAKIKNSVKEKEHTPIKDQEGNKTQPLSASKMRPMIRGNRSNSLDNLQNLDYKKIVMKYVCPICTSMYVYASKLLRHMQERHNPNLTKIPKNCERLQCPFCRALLSNKNYNKHVKLNHPEKLNENVGDVENNNNTDKCKNEKLGSIKNKIFLNRSNTESNKSSEATKANDKKLTSVDITRQQKNQRRSECKYQHLIRRIKIGDVNHDKQDEIPGKKDEELGPDKDDAQYTSIENESGSTAVASTGDITSSINSTILHHTEWYRGELDKSSELKLAAKPNSIYDEEERTPSECNDRNIDTIEESDVSSLRNDNMHDNNETSHNENNDSKSDETEPEKSNTSKESIINRIDDEEHSSRRFSNDEYNESETSNNHGFDNDISVTNGNEPLNVTCTVENRKHGSDELSIRYINHGKETTENTVIEGSQTRSSNINKEKETDNEDDCIKASDYTVKKRKERITKLFGDENEVSVSSKIMKSKLKEESRSEQSSELNTSQKEHQTPKDRDKKTARRRGNRKADVVHRRSKVTVEQCTENAESSDSDWIISNDESSDSCDEYCTIKKQQVVRKLFSSEIKPSVRNGRNEESSTESGDNNYDSDEEAIKSSRYTLMKNKQRLSRLFSDDNELSLSDEISKEEDRQAASDKNGLRSDRQCAGVEDGNKESVPSNNEQEVSSDNETLKVSEHTVKKRMERISKQFGNDNETFVHESNQQMENSDMNADDGRTKVVNVSAEDTQCYAEIPEMRDDGTNNESCVNETNHEKTSSRKNGIDEATDRNYIIAVDEEENMNAVRNAENMSLDDDRNEINMIDRLLKELTSDDHQNGARADKECNNEANRKSEISAECQATSDSATVKTCLENIRITNVTSVEGKTHVFICEECNYGTDAYDDAIRHCQNHHNLIEDQVTYCDICQINYDTVCFERHQSSHHKYLGNIKIKFSYHWLFTNWQVVFENNNISLSEAEDMQVKSIYKTFCVKMAVKEDGPWQSAVYLCANCNTCVLPLDVEKHSQQKCTFVDYPCRMCHRVFSTYELRKHHEIYHKDDASKLFKTIVFNGPNDENFNSKLIQVKTQGREKQRIVDIFKCLCGVCFISLKKFKLHFADCDPELNDGRQCPRCTGIRLFSTTELEEHVLLHHSSLNYEFRVQKITFQLESIIDSSERKTPLETSNGTDNATQMTSYDEDLNIKRDLLKDESFTQTTGEENRRENFDKNDEEGIKSDQINEPVPKTSVSITDNAAQMRSNDLDLTIKRDMLKAESLTQTTYKENRQENIDNTEEADINRAIIYETVPGTSDSTTGKVAQITSNDENLNIKGNMKPLTQSSDGENRPENTDQVEKEVINRRLINETVTGMNDEDLIIKRDMLKDETLTQNTHEENSQKIADTDEKEDIGRKGNSQEIRTTEDSENTVDTEASQEVMVVEQSVSLITIEGSQEMEVEESTHLITIEDSDDDVEFIGETFPNLTKIFPLRYCSKR